MRVRDWPARLYELTETSEPFEYGRHDCCLFAAKVIDGLTGTHWVDDLRACYHDEASAKAYIAAEGGIEASVTRRLGPPGQWSQARRGDLCLVNTRHGPALGICVGAKVAIAGENGTMYQPLELALKAWRID
jgi:hypothetical protein